MGISDAQWDRLLKIRTSGRDDSHADRHHYPYEPTPYSVLERLASGGFISKKNVVLDYGCGKGRVDFFLASQLRCRCVGVEYDGRIYEAACANQKKAVSAARVEFVHSGAEEYPVPPDMDRFYFFNPFSVEILQKVLGRICGAGDGRERLLFFYYPSDEYVSCLMTSDDLLFEDEMDCRDLFAGDDGRERILIFRVR